MRNKYPGICYRCGTTVDAGDGHFERNTGGGPGKWRTQHASCAIRWRGQPAPSQAQALQERQAHLAGNRKGKRS